MSLRCNVCTLADSWTVKCPVLRHLFRCFDSPRFKENALCHPAFVIRDINICRNGYLQGRLKSRKSYHCCKCYRIQISYKSYLKTFRHFAAKVCDCVISAWCWQIYDVLFKCCFAKIVCARHWYFYVGVNLGVYKSVAKEISKPPFFGSWSEDTISMPKLARIC